MNSTREISNWDQRSLRASLALTCVALTAFPCSSLASPQPENPYRNIALRNVFGLRPPVTPAKNTAPASVPSPTIVLTGITTIFGDKRAFLEITAPPKPGQPPAKPEACMLTVGQSDAGVEVVEIDPKLGHVRVSTAGGTVTLTFEQNGKKTKPAPAVAAFAQHKLPIIRSGTLR